MMIFSKKKGERQKKNEDNDIGFKHQRAEFKIGL